MSSSLESKLSQYKAIDDSSFSSDELSHSYWIVTHKIFFRNLLIGLLLVTDILLAVYAVTGFVSYIFVGQSREQASVAELARRVNVSSVEKIKARGAQPLQFGTTQIFDAGNSTFDFVTPVQNTNPEWYALVTYNFDVTDASSTATRTVYILPNEEKFLTILGEKRGEASISDATLHIIGTQWTRINPHDIPDATAFMKQHSVFVVQNAAFTPSTDTTGNAITFDISNYAPYNFWAVPVQIQLRGNGQVQGIEETVISKFRQGEQRSITIRNFEKNMVVDEVRVVPSVDIFDPTVYMAQ